MSLTDRKGGEIPIPLFILRSENDRNFNTSQELDAISFMEGDGPLVNAQPNWLSGVVRILFYYVGSNSIIRAAAGKCGEAGVKFGEGDFDGSSGAVRGGVC